MKKTSSTDTREINFIYPWSPHQFAKLLASTYVGQSHFVRMRWDYSGGHNCDPLVAIGLGDITQIVVAAVALSSNGLVGCLRWLGHYCDPLVATGSGDITQIAVAAVALSSNGLVGCLLWLVAATEWS
jgi:hypothetical protein